MTWVNRVCRFFSFFQLYPALVAIVPVYFSAEFCGVDFSVKLFLIALLVGIAIFSFNRVTDRIEDGLNKPTKVTIRAYDSIISPIVFCILAVVLGLLVSGVRVVLVLLVPLILGFFYSKKVFKSLPRFKDVLGLKNIVVAFCVAFLASFLISFMGAVNFGMIALVFVYVFIQFFINTALFDVFDMSGDKIANVHTLPLKFGVKRFAYFLLVLNSLLFVWLGLTLISGLVIRHLFVAVLGIFYTYVCIWYFTKNTDKRSLATVFVDGQWLFLSVLMWAI